MKIGKIIATGLLSLSLLTGTTYAAPAWQLPAQGKVFATEADKQAYIEDYMKKFLRKEIKLKFASPDKWTYEKFTVNGIKVERLVNPKQKKSKRVVLQLHGGGYVFHLSDWYRDFGVKQAVMTDAHEVWLVDYRIAPEHIYPAALDDSAQVYAEILNRGVDPKNLIVFGDSAGGNLALELALHLKEKNLPQPAVLILLSPRTTFENNMPSRINNAKRDFVLGELNTRMYTAMKNPVYAGNIPLNDPRLSPIYADLTGLPPTLIQVGGHELFLDEGIELLKKASVDELNITLSVYQGMSHVFSILLPDLDDSIKSFAEIKDFVNRNLPR